MEGGDSRTRQGGVAAERGTATRRASNPSPPWPESEAAHTLLSSPSTSSLALQATISLRDQPEFQLEHAFPLAIVPDDELVGWVERVATAAEEEDERRLVK